MMTIRQYEATCRNEWDEFVRTSKNGFFMFERGYMDYHADRFTDCSLMIYDDKQTLVALLPATIDKEDNAVVSHGGLTYGGLIVGEKMKQHTMLEIFDLMLAYLRTEGYVELRYKQIPHIYHKYPAEEDLYALYRHQATLLKVEPSTTIDLTCPYKMPKGTKAQIARAKKNEVLIVPSDDFDTFIDLENQVLMEHHNKKAVHTADELRLLHSRFPNQIQLWTAMKDNQMIAATLLFVSDQVVHTQYMASNDIGRQMGALDLLIAEMISKSKEQNKRYFDFGISSEDLGRYLNEGLIAQKEHLGGRTVVYNTYTIKL